MEFNELKSTWNALKTPEVSTTEIQSMLSENRHPVLKDIRKQLTIEIIGWGIFLACYYSMFDGDKKPVWINVLLCLSILIPIIHNLMGYRFAKYLVQGTSIQESLKNYLSKVKVYAIVSVVSRQIYLLGLLFFFTYSINFNAGKYTLLGVIGLVFLIQFVIICRIWVKRLKSLGDSLKSFS
ncbi:hypothetical protein [Pedobacter nyackensis]|uniref:hypothetical protein n=1 Tax=Pedobacter nyackensis TaxID=475255 RepID=UPI0029304A3E|nr:hypothetical protein [Pedobacter nyackensis]